MSCGSSFIPSSLLFRLWGILFIPIRSISWIILFVFLRRPSFQKISSFSVCNFVLQIFFIDASSFVSIFYRCFVKYSLIGSRSLRSLVSKFFTSLVQPFFFSFFRSIHEFFSLCSSEGHHFRRFLRSQFSTSSSNYSLLMSLRSSPVLRWFFQVYPSVVIVLIHLFFSQSYRCFVEDLPKLVLDLSLILSNENK